MMTDITALNETTVNTKRIIGGSEKMESIFNTVEMIRGDLTQCGMRLTELAKFLGFPLFINSDYSFKVIYGIDTEILMDDAKKSAATIVIKRKNFYKKGKRIVICDPGYRNYEINEISAVEGNLLILETGLQYDYPINSPVVVLKDVEYKYDAKQNILKRKVNNGYFQPMIEEVTDFYVKFFPESCSVLYRVEIEKKEQIRGYIFMNNMEIV
jgi:hypothetical protein